MISRAIQWKTLLREHICCHPLCISAFPPWQKPIWKQPSGNHGGGDGEKEAVIQPKSYRATSAGSWNAPRVLFPAVHEINPMLFTVCPRYRWQPLSWRRRRPRITATTKRSAKQLKASMVCWTKIQVKNLKCNMFVHTRVENHILLLTLHRAWAGLVQKSRARSTCCGNANQSWPVMANLTSVQHSYSNAGSAVLATCSY